MNKRSLLTIIGFILAGVLFSWLSSNIPPGSCAPDTQIQSAAHEPKPLITGIMIDGLASSASQVDKIVHHPIKLLSKGDSKGKVVGISPCDSLGFTILAVEIGYDIFPCIQMKRQFALGDSAIIWETKFPDPGAIVSRERLGGGGDYVYIAEPLEK